MFEIPGTMKLIHICLTILNYDQCRLGRIAMERKLCQLCLKEEALWTTCKLLEPVVRVKASGKVGIKLL